MFPLKGFAMQPDSTTILTIVNDPLKLVQLVGGIVAIIGGLVVIIPKLRLWWVTYYNRRTLLKRKGAELYTREDIHLATRFYIKPNCQNVDPSQEEEIRGVYPLTKDLFATIDEMLSNPAKYKYRIILTV